MKCTFCRPKCPIQTLTFGWNTTSFQYKFGQCGEFIEKCLSFLERSEYGAVCVFVCMRASSSNALSCDYQSDAKTKCSMSQTPCTICAIQPIPYPFYLVNNQIKRRKIKATWNKNRKNKNRIFLSLFRVEISRERTINERVYFVFVCWNYERREKKKYAQML